MFAKTYTTDMAPRHGRKGRRRRALSSQAGLLLTLLISFVGPLLTRSLPGFVGCDAILPDEARREGGGGVLAPEHLPVANDHRFAERTASSQRAGSEAAHSVLRAESMAALGAATLASSLSKSGMEAGAGVGAGAAASAGAGAGGGTADMIMKNMIIVIAAVSVGFIITAIGVFLFLYKSGLLGMVSRATGMPNPEGSLPDDVKGAMNDTVGEPAAAEGEEKK